MANFSKDDVVNALRKVDDPDLHKDLVTLNMVKEIHFWLFTGILI